MIERCRERRRRRPRSPRQPAGPRLLLATPASAVHRRSVCQVRWSRCGSVGRRGFPRRAMIPGLAYVVMALAGAAVVWGIWSPRSPTSRRARPSCCSPPASWLVTLVQSIIAVVSADRAGIPPGSPGHHDRLPDRHRGVDPGGLVLGERRAHPVLRGGAGRRRARRAGDDAAAAAAVDPGRVTAAAEPRRGPAPAPAGPWSRSTASSRWPPPPARACSWRPASPRRRWRTCSRPSPG